MTCGYYATAKFLVVLVDRLFHQAYVGFRRFCVESENLPADLHIVLSDILQEAGLYMQTNVNFSNNATVRTFCYFSV